MFKKKNKLLLFTTLLIIILLLVAYNQYQTKKMYEEHLSQTVSADMQTLVISIIKSDEIYKGILDKGNITRRDAESLRIYSYDILSIPQDYNGLALEFGRMGSREFQNKIADTAQEISHFFYKMNEDIYVEEKNLDEVICELNDEKTDVIHLLKELNSLWSEAVLKNVVGASDYNGNLEYDSEKFQDHYGDNSLTDDFWVDLIVDIDKSTREFLTTHELRTVNDIFNK